MTTEAYIFAGIALFMYIMGVVLIFAAFHSYAKPKARFLIALVWPLVSLAFGLTALLGKAINVNGGKE